jgi:FkbM family methyltransferase
MKKIIRKKINKIIKVIKKIPFIRNVFSLVITRLAFPKRNLNDSLKGYKAYIFDSSYVNEKNFQEPHIIKFFKNNIKKKDVVFDVGAHFGYFTLLSHKLVGERGKVISFEPSPIPLKFLRKNIRLNNLNNVIIKSLMVSNKKEKHDFYYSGFGGTMSSFKKSDELPYKKIVNSITLDEYCNTNNIFPNFIKIDVEGADLLAIKGLKKTLSKRNINVLLELHHKQLSKEEIKELVDIFKELKYSTYSIFRKENDYYLEYFNIKNLPNHLFFTKNEKN